MKCKACGYEGETFPHTPMGKYCCPQCGAEQTGSVLPMEDDYAEQLRKVRQAAVAEQERQAQGKKMHVSDERFFKEAEKLLYDEFAMVLEIKPEEVLPFILEQLRAEEAQPEHEPPEKQQAEEQTTTTDRNS